MCRIQKIIATFVIVNAYIHTSNAQCAMCKAVVESGQKEMAEGVNNGITYLMVFPYILVGFLVYWLLRYKRKMNNQQS